MSRNTIEIIEMETLYSIDKLFHTILSETFPPDSAYRRCLRDANYLKDKLPKYIDNILSEIDDEYKDDYARWKQNEIEHLAETGEDFEVIHPDLKE